MKIAFVTATRPHAGGMINYLNNFSRGMKLLGHQADIISIFETTGQRKKLPKVDSFFGKIFTKRDWLGFLAIQLIKIIIFFRFLKNYLLKKYDFVYVTDVISYNALNFLEKFYKIPVILNPIDSLHSIMIYKKLAKPNGWFSKYLIDQEKKAYLSAKALLASGLDIQKYCQKIAGKEIDLPIIDNPVDETKFFPDLTRGEELKNNLNLKNKFIVLFVGRISPDKGIIYLLKALSLILEKEPSSNIVVVIGGAPGLEKDNLLNYIKENDLEKFAKFLGYIKDEEIRAIYNMADIFCAPSVTFTGETTNYLKASNNLDLTVSTTPMTAVEAMACGKPIILTNVPGSKEVVEDNFNGLLIPEKDPQALAETILKIKNDPQLRSCLARGALITYQNRFLPKKIAQILIDYYKKVFNR